MTRDGTRSGSYRATYDTLPDDYDFQNLTPLAQAVFGTLKLKLGMYGIGAFYLSALPEIHRKATRKKLDEAIAELEEAKPGKRHGWIRRGRNIVWLVNGLRFEPSVSLLNKNHRLGALRYAETLPSDQVVTDFVAYYRLESVNWMPPAWDADGMGTPSASPDSGRGITETETEADTEQRTTASSSTSILPTEAAIAAVLPSDADRAALTALLVTAKSPSTWLAEMAASLNAMPGHVHVTPAQLGITLRDFVGNGAAEKDPALNHFRAYLGRTARARASPPRPNRFRRSGRPPTDPGFDKIGGDE